MSDTMPLILALDVAGNPFKWVNYEDAAYYYAKDLVAWDLGGDGCVLRGGTQRRTGKQSLMEISSIIAIKGMKVSSIKGYSVPPLTNKALFRRDHNLCAYCGDTFSPSSLSRDHVRPKSKGGPDIWTNVVTACETCNRHKNDRTPQEAKMELLYVPYAPNRSCFLILMNRNILADQMDFLLAKSNHITHDRVMGERGLLRSR